eukprot:GHVO01056597.1.p1 GENE.GHVO01056597.1~~GHVO01056597.1.p1  ORF type:complete len:212 (+),score=33.50 GHVO01056597.1:345-980(+)
MTTDSPPTSEAFGTSDTDRGISECMKYCHIILSHRGKEDIENQIEHIDHQIQQHARPNWDTYFMRIACMAATRSNCMKRQVGAVIVKDRRIVSTGYNGTPSNTTNCCDGGCERCNEPERFSQGEGLDSCACIHAEMNALIEAGREKCMGGTMYVTLMPCIGCAKVILQVGIKDVCYAREYVANGGSIELFQKNKIQLRQFKEVDLLSSIQT